MPIRSWPHLICQLQRQKTGIADVGPKPSGLAQLRNWGGDARRHGNHQSDWCFQSSCLVRRKSNGRDRGVATATVTTTAQALIGPWTPPGVRGGYHSTVVKMAYRAAVDRFRERLWSKPSRQAMTATNAMQPIVLALSPRAYSAIGTTGLETILFSCSPPLDSDW